MHFWLTKHKTNFFSTTSLFVGRFANVGVVPGDVEGKAWWRACAALVALTAQHSRGVAAVPQQQEMTASWHYRLAVGDCFLFLKKQLPVSHPNYMPLPLRAHREPHYFDRGFSPRASLTNPSPLILSSPPTPPFVCPVGDAHHHRRHRQRRRRFRRSPTPVLPCYDRAAASARERCLTSHFFQPALFRQGA